MYILSNIKSKCVAAGCELSAHPCAGSLRGENGKVYQAILLPAPKQVPN